LGFRSGKRKQRWHVRERRSLQGYSFRNKVCRSGYVHHGGLERSRVLQGAVHGRRDEGRRFALGSKSSPLNRTSKVFCRTRSCWGGGLLSESNPSPKMLFVVRAVMRIRMRDNHRNPFLLVPVERLPRRRVLLGISLRKNHRMFRMVGYSSITRLAPRGSLRISMALSRAYTLSSRPNACAKVHVE
jgi:hypothetical protein